MNVDVRRVKLGRHPASLPSRETPPLRASATACRRGSALVLRCVSKDRRGDFHADIDLNNVIDAAKHSPERHHLDTKIVSVSPRLRNDRELDRIRTLALSVGISFQLGLARIRQV